MNAKPRMGARVSSGFGNFRLGSFGSAAVCMQPQLTAWNTRMPSNMMRPEDFCRSHDKLLRRLLSCMQTPSPWVLHVLGNVAMAPFERLAIGSWHVTSRIG
jgi:hypothetical protein